MAVETNLDQALHKPDSDPTPLQDPKRDDPRPLHEDAVVAAVEHASTAEIVLLQQCLE